MNKKVFLLGVMMILALALVFSTAWASDTKTAAKTQKAPTLAANFVAVCGCGKVFVPNEKTEYMTVNGKKYACCSHECHEAAVAMAQKDPAGTAKMMELKMAETMEKMSPKTTSTTTEAAPK